MEKLDFLFIYEHKVRELENLCLMKYELDRRGYKTKILYVEDEEALKAVKPFYYAKVAVLMACYGNHTLEWQTKDCVRFDKVIDLQWENIVYPMDEKNVKAYKNRSIVYSVPLVREIAERFKLDFSDRTSMTFDEAEYTSYEGSPVLIIKIK